ncbi:unnamed protein product, partial [Callosobruchus maculatus]
FRSTLFILVTLVTILQAEDPPKYKTCAETSFCKTLRGQIPTDDLKLILDSFPNNAANQDSAVVKLKSSGGIACTLNIELLKNNLVRVKLIDGQYRYEIPEGIVLERKNQEIIKLNNSNDGTILTVVPYKKEDGQQQVIFNKNDSTLSFYYGEVPKVVVDISKIYLQKKAGNEEFAFNVSFKGAKQLYGLHHHAYNLELTDTVQKKDDKYIGEPFRLRNTDKVNFKADSTESLYGSVPVLYGYSPNSTSGIFVHNAAEQWVDLSKEAADPSAQFMVYSGSMDLFVLLGPHIEDVVQQFTYLTGKAHMPQIWTLGYHQCRWSYDTEDKVLDVMKNMKNNSFPMDAIWLDIDYTKEYEYFTWDTTKFPTAGNMLKTLGENHKKLVAIIDPHIKFDTTYPVYQGAKTNKYFVQNSDGTDYVGVSWPGKSSWIDFLNEDASKYYAAFYSDSNFHQNQTKILAGIWNDMNEPSVENRQDNEMSMPYELIHKYKSVIGLIDVKHGDIHNIYGLLHTMSTHQGLMARDNNGRRPFILTRSHFAGSQRYAAMWTGDNTPDWAHLKSSYSECMLSNLVGHVFCGADIPGFFEIEKKPTEVFVYRAYQAGIWLPFFRGHASKYAENREPYRYNETTQGLIRSAIRMRYRHIPTWYQLFYEHTQTGAPVIRPLFYNFSGEIGYNDHIMLGDNILARPVFEPDVKEVNVHLPGKGLYWYRIDGKSVKAYEGGTDTKINVENGESPVFYRGGSIIVTRDRDVMSTEEGSTLPLTVYVNLDKNFEAAGRLYNDDGYSFDYKQKKFLYAHLMFDEKKMLQVEPIGDQNHEDLTVVVEKVVVNDWAVLKDVSTHHTSDEDGNLFSNVDVVKALRSNGNKVLYKLRR